MSDQNESQNPIGLESPFMMSDLDWKRVFGKPFGGAESPIRKAAKLLPPDYKPPIPISSRTGT